jgi:predicted transposase YbfD/YdcC
LPVQSAMPAAGVAAVDAALDAGAAAAALLAPLPAAPGTLLEMVAAVPDPRDSRGIRHQLPVILGLAQAAATAGCVTVTEIAAWAAAAPQDLLARLGSRRDPCGRRVAPHPDTVGRVLEALDPQPLADTAGAYLAARAGLGPAVFPLDGPVLQPAMAVDGKAMRGAIGDSGLVPYLLAAATHGAIGQTVVVAERLIGPKTNEVPEVPVLLRGLAGYADISGCVLTLDALHTVRSHATLICEELLGHYVMTVKANTPKLHEALDALDWDRVPVQHAARESGHGRKEKRTIQVMDAPDHIRELFPHVRQVALIERYTIRKARKRKKNSRRHVTTEVKTAVAVFVITSMTSREAAPEHIAAYVRGHWGIENKIHWVRDVTFREDHSRVRTGPLPRVMATLRNLTIGLIRLAGHTRIAATIRKIRHSPPLLTSILGLPESYGNQS